MNPTAFSTATNKSLCLLMLAHPNAAVLRLMSQSAVLMARLMITAVLYNVLESLWSATVSVPISSTVVTLALACISQFIARTELTTTTSAK